MSNNTNLREQSVVVLLSLLMFMSAASGIYWMTWQESFHCLVICSLELVGNILIKGTRTTRANKQRAERQRDQFADFGGLHLNTLFESPQPDECFSIYWYWSRIPENIGKLLRTPGEFNEEEERMKRIAEIDGFKWIFRWLEVTTIWLTGVRIWLQARTRWNHFRNTKPLFWKSGDVCWI